MKKSILAKKRKPRPKLINRQAVTTDPEIYGQKHIKSIQNEEGFYR